jgi:hypothetical protein
MGMFHPKDGVTTNSQRVIAVTLAAIRRATPDGVVTPKIVDTSGYLPKNIVGLPTDDRLAAVLKEAPVENVRLAGRKLLQAL